MVASPSRSARSARDLPRPAAAGTSCAHCTLPVPAGLVEQGAPRQFCCQGCRTAFEVIHTCGLDRYYALLQESTKESSGAGRSVRPTGRRYAEFDDPVFRELYVRPAPTGPVCTTDLYLENVHCSACVWLVERLPVVAPGVLDARLDIRRGMVRVTWDDSRLALSAIAGVLDSLGYPPHPARDRRAREARQREDRRQLVRLGVAGACAGNVMLLALALYAGVFDGMEAVYIAYFRWTSMAVSLVSLAWPGSVFFKGAWAAVRVRTLNIDVPIALGLLAGTLWSIVSTILGVGEIYFDTLSVLVFALLAGRFVQGRQQRAAGDAVELLFSLTPSSARLVDGNDVRDVPIEAVARGDTVEVRPGDSVPVDGEVLEGESLLDQSLLTGEARPVEAGVGAWLTAGSVNLSGRLLVRVDATGEQTRIGKLMRTVEECTQKRAPIVLFADAAAKWFTLGMLALSAVTLLAWWRVSPSRALEHASALLIVTCPCALGLATPLAITVALGRAARRGILIKGGEALQRLATPGTIFLDKTGTLTFGKPRVLRWVGDESLKAPVAALESGMTHPVALALAALTPEHDRPETLRAVEGVQTLGGGVEGIVAGLAIIVGSPAFLRSRGVRFPRTLEDALHQCIREGLTPVVVGVDREARALACLGDELRPDSPDAISALRRLGWRVRVLSGDDVDVTRAVAHAAGVESPDALGGAAPEEKLRVIRHAGANTVMVGDGVNDAAALAAAGVGIAVHGGAEASLAAADVYLNRPGLASIAELLSASTRTMRTIRANLAASLFYNVLAGGLAVAGVLNPILAAVVMPVSSLTVVALSLRARTFGATPRRDTSGARP